MLAGLRKRLTNAEIAANLFLSERTVESHVSSLLRKFAVPNRLALLHVAAHDEAPDHTLPPALALLADPNSYFGRPDERAQLDRLWHTARDGVCVVAVVGGEAGIGKSRLVAELANTAHAEGARVLFGADIEDVERPFEPFVQAIASDAALITDAQLRERAGSGAEALARVVPGLATRLGVSTDALVFDGISARTDSFAALHTYLTRTSSHAPLVLVLEDAHWATTTTLGAIKYLATVAGRAPMLVVVTTRDAAPDVREPLSVFLGEMDRLPNVERVTLRGLDSGSVAQLIESLGSDADPVTLTVESGGNPLFVRERAQGDETGSSLVALLARRDARLDRATSGVLDVAAVIGANFDASAVAQAIGAPRLDVIEALDTCVEAGLVVRVPGEGLAYRFVHELFRMVRYDGLSEATRLRLHYDVALAFADYGRDPADVARHACIAAPLGCADIAVEFTEQAASQAEQAFAFAEAAVLCRRAIDAAAYLDPPDPGRTLRLSIRLGEAMQAAGEGGYEDVLIHAAAEARARGDAEALAEVGWAMVKYGGPRHPSRDAKFVAIAQEALEELGPAPTAARARTLAAASEDLCFTDPSRATVLAHEALAIARRLDDPLTLGHVLLSYRVAADTPDNPKARHPTADELIAIGNSTRQPAFTMLGLYHRAFSYRGEGNLAAADVALEEALLLRGDRSLPPTYAAAVIMFRAAREFLAGRLESAESIANEVWAIETDGFAPMNWYGPAVLAIRHAQGRIGELLPILTPAVDQPGIGDIYQSVLAAALAHDGDIDQARAILSRFADTAFSGVARNFSWLASLVALAEATELTNDVEAARAIIGLLGPFSERIAELPQCVVGSVDFAIAQCALTLNAVTLADEVALRAVDASRVRDTPIFLGRELVRLAAARVRSGDDDVGELVQEALAIEEATGAHLIAADLERYDLR